jgi:hopanoid biosynthesis associated glycosyl transferase protein HpnI
MSGHAAIGLGLGAIVLLYPLLAIAGQWAWSRRCGRDAGSLPPFSILKPLCGLEEHLYGNLRSFCEQRYPRFEVVFGVHSRRDPALAVVRRLQREFPHIPMTVVVQGTNGGPNRKIGNLAAILEHASFEHLVFSDSSTRVDPDYLRNLAACLDEEDVGVVTCLYRAQPTSSRHSRLAALYMNLSFTPSIMLGWMLGMRDFGFGATLALRRSHLAVIGGLKTLADHLADDYMLARMLRRHGLRTVLSPHLVDTVVDESSFSSLWRHEMRWVRAVRMLQPVGHAASIVTHTLPLSLLAYTLIATLPLAWLLPSSALALRLGTAVAAAVWNRLPAADILWLPLRDFLTFAVWVGSYCGRRVHWRGRVFELARDGAIRDLHPSGSIADD